MEKFKAFKKNVPVMGGILLDKTLQRVLLVKGWKNTACWGFPRGKIHENETDTQCAVREVRNNGSSHSLCAYSTMQPFCAILGGHALQGRWCCEYAAVYFCCSPCSLLSRGSLLLQLCLQAVVECLLWLSL
eukprot:GHUV01042438.1.p1 GENE.GHUV01042438.1~~GHUV01042438.1.p1  ORF type:complete len:131 (-),score=27.87 GHUV01042438.1:479-871(-)